MTLRIFGSFFNSFFLFRKNFLQAIYIETTSIFMSSQVNFFLSKNKQTQRDGLKKMRKTFRKYFFFLYFFPGPKAEYYMIVEREREREMTTTESMFDSMNRMIQREREGEKFENKIQLIQFCLMHQKLNKINKNIWSVFFLLGNFSGKK